MLDVSLLLGRVQFDLEPSSSWTDSNVIEMNAPQKQYQNQQQIPEKDQILIVLKPLRGQKRRSA